MELHISIIYPSRNHPKKNLSVCSHVCHGLGEPASGLSKCRWDRPADRPVLDFTPTASTVHAARLHGRDPLGHRHRDLRGLTAAAGAAQGWCESHGWNWWEEGGFGKKLDGQMAKCLFFFGGGNWLKWRASANSMQLMFTWEPSDHRKWMNQKAGWVVEWETVLP